MFLDDELEKIYQEEGCTHDSSIKLLKACINRMPSKEEVKTMNPSVFLTKLKQIDNAWKLFCKKHPMYKEDGWRKWVLRSDTPDGKFKNALNW